MRRILKERPDRSERLDSLNTSHRRACSLYRLVCEKCVIPLERPTLACSRKGMHESRWGYLYHLLAFTLEQYRQGRGGPPTLEKGTPTLELLCEPLDSCFACQSYSWTISTLQLKRFQTRTFRGN